MIKNNSEILTIRLILIVCCVIFYPALAQTQADVTLRVGSINVMPGSSDNLIEVSLENPDHKVSAIETLLVDEDDNLTCTGCVPDPVRAPDFMCFAYEQGAGGCKVVMVDISTSKLIEIGNGTVFTIL